MNSEKLITNYDVAINQWYYQVVLIIHICWGMGIIGWSFMIPDLPLFVNILVGCSIPLLIYSDRKWNSWLQNPVKCDSIPGK